MKCFLFWLLLQAPFLTAAEPAGAGEWSAPIDGLRGRLSFVESKLFDGSRIARIYLELENISGVLNPLLIDRHTPEVSVIDAVGKVLPEVHPVIVEEMFPPPYTLVLPFEATLRLRISVSSWKVWNVSEKQGEERYLIGTFSIPKLKGNDIEGRQKDSARGNRVWRGTLDLPKLKLPAL